MRVWVRNLGFWVLWVLGMVGEVCCFRVLVLGFVITVWVLGIVGSGVSCVLLFCVRLV